MKAAQPFAKALQARDGARLRNFVECLVVVQPFGQTYGFAQAIQRVGVITVDARDLAMERIRAEVNRSDSGVFSHAGELL